MAADPATGPPRTRDEPPAPATSSSAAIVGGPIFDHRLAPAIALGATVATAVVITLLRYAAAAWRRAEGTPLSTYDE